MPKARATGPDDRVPTKLPAIAAPVHSGKSRLGLAGIEDRAGHRPGDRHADGAHRIDRQPGQQDGRVRPARHQRSLDEQDHGGAAEQPGEQAGSAATRPSAAP